MNSTLLIQDIKSEVGSFDLVEEFYSLFSQKSYKNDLNRLLIILERDTINLNYLKDLNNDELDEVHKIANRYSTILDKLDEMYRSANYFEDSELKQLFRSVTRKFHKLENFSYKYLNKDKMPKTSQTPDYIKEGLARFSKEALTKKLYP